MSDHNQATKTLMTWGLLGYLHEAALLERKKIEQVVSHLNTDFQAFASVSLDPKRRTAILRLHTRAETACKNQNLMELKKLAQELGGFIRNYNRENPSKLIPKQIIKNLQG